jgi:hypothetical protein
VNISILTSANPELRQQLARLDSDGPQDAKGAAVERDVVAVVKHRPAGNVAPSTRFASMRAALDARIAEDTGSGRLSADGATAVKATLDEIDNRSGGTDPSPHAAGQDRASFGGYAVACTPGQVARQYLATIPLGTLIDRFG